MQDEYLVYKIMEFFKLRRNKKGMEMVQVAILVAIAIGLGMLFRERISDFISSTFDSLANTKF